jgi:spermidine synthase
VRVLTDYEHHSPYHRLRVTDNDGVRLLKFERNQQSSMRLNDPFETDIEYVGYLHLTIAVCPQATRALVIGLGGGSLVKRMWRDYPWMHIDAVELDPDVIEIARELFALPDDERIRVIAGDGREFIETCPERYDIVVIDAFDDDRVPRQLTTEEFMRACRDRLTSDGVIAYNVIGSVYGPHSKHFRSLHRTAGNVWRRVWTFPVQISSDARDQTRNIVLLASDANLSNDELFTRIATRVDKIVTVPAFERFAEDLYSGAIRTGDVPLLVDEARGRSQRKRRG